MDTHSQTMHVGIISKQPKIGWHEIRTNTKLIYNNDLINYGLKTNKRCNNNIQKTVLTWHLKSEAHYSI